MTDLFAIFSKLVTPGGQILIPGIADKVAPLTPQEKALYDVIDITVADFESAVGGKVTLSQDKAEVLMGRMRYPRFVSVAFDLACTNCHNSFSSSLSIHGVEGAFSGAGAKTVIPASVHGRF